MPPFELCEQRFFFYITAGAVREKEASFRRHELPGAPVCPPSPCGRRTGTAPGDAPRLWVSRLPGSLPRRESWSLSTHAPPLRPLLAGWPSLVPPWHSVPLLLLGSGSLAPSFRVWESAGSLHPTGWVVDPAGPTTQTCPSPALSLLCICCFPQVPCAPGLMLRTVRLSRHGPLKTWSHPW